MGKDVYWLEGVSLGRLGIVPRPRGRDWLKGEVRSWRRARVDTVVSLLTPEEIVELGLEAEEKECSDGGIRFLSLPIPDRGLPPSRAALQEVIAALQSDLASGNSVVVHCRQGIGRSSLVLATLLLQLGDSPDRAFRRIEDARGQEVPDTEEQRDWVKRFAEAVAPAAPRTPRTPAPLPAD